VIIDPVVNRDVEAVCFAAVRRILRTHLIDVASAGKEWPTMPVDAILVVREREYTIRGLECLLDTIAVMNVNIDVQDALMLGQQELYCDDDVVDIAKARCKVLLCVVQTARPINGYVGLLVQ
jgi:hypothetical protein